MSSTRFRILIFPEEAGQVRQLQLNPGVILAFLVTTFAAFSIGAGYLAADYFHLRSGHEELLRLRAEKRVYQEELRLLALQALTLRQNLEAQARYDARFRILSQQPVADDVNENALGGPMEPDNAEAIGTIQGAKDLARQHRELQLPPQEEIRARPKEPVGLTWKKPSGWPVRGRVSSHFGVRKSPFSGRQIFHEGIDIAAPAGTPVFASAKGTVSTASYAAGYGNLIVIDHGNGYQTAYGHNSKIFVKVGQQVKKGQKIAAVGSTGRSTGPHLHYEVRLHGKPVNPRKFL
ncbi:MAG: M23 family metallopeptidase [Deltaproteobacteria bacterium]|nr:M23 family metallopeptidase [Deltaproteobacteria bacterium]